MQYLMNPSPQWDFDSAGRVRTARRAATPKIFWYRDRPLGVRSTRGSVRMPVGVFDCDMSVLSLYCVAVCLQCVLVCAFWLCTVCRVCKRF